MPGANRVYVDPLEQRDQHRFNFTLMHEISHFWFHRDLDIKQIDDTIRHLSGELKQENNPRYWIEWQANRLAGAVLVPTATLREALTDTQKQLGIMRNLGLVYDNPGNRRDFRCILESLSVLFDVSPQVINVRLNQCKLVVEQVEQQPRHRHVRSILPRVLDKLT